MAAALHLFHYCVYLALRSCEGLVLLLPLNCAFVLGRAGGTIAYWCMRKRRNGAFANLQSVYGAAMSKTQLRALNRKHFELLGANLLAGLKASTMPNEKIWERVTAHLPAERPHHGWVAAVSHIGCWELLSYLGAKFPQYRFGAIYRRFYNPYVDRYLRQTRARSGTELFDRHDDLLRCVRFLREGGVVGVLVDQGAGHAGAWMPLFNRLASSSTLAATLSIRSGLPLVPLAIYTRGTARWEMIISSPIFPTTDDPQLLTAQMNRALERQIQRAPADWLWAHNRWKPNRPGFLLTRDDRRVFFPPDFDRSKLVPFRILIVSPDSAEAAAATLPAVRAIKNGRPDAWLATLASANLGDLWRNVPDIDHVIESRRAESIFTLALRIRHAGKFDAAIFFAPSWKTALAIRLTGIPIRVARRCGAMSLLFNERPSQPKDPLDPVRLNLRLARSIGANIKQPAIKPLRLNS